MPPVLAEAAQEVASEEEVTRELFAAGLLPMPNGYMPLPKDSREAEVCWVNRPPYGKLRGDLFTDGSSLWA